MQVRTRLSEHPKMFLRAMVIERDSTSDAFEYDPVTGEWVATSGDMVETIVVDAETKIVVLREEVFNGELLRRVTVSGVENLG